MAVNDVFADEADDGAPGTNGAPFFVPDDETFIASIASDRTGRSALACATASALRPWRGLMLALGLHLCVVAVALLLITAHLPAPPPDGPVISVVMETLPRGSPAPVSQAQAATQVPAPIAGVAIGPRGRTCAAGFAGEGEQTCSELPLRPRLPRASNVTGAKIGNMIVAATRPASPDAGSTVYYSEIARAQGEQGEVRLRILISPAGKPDRVTMERELRLCPAG